MGKLHCITSITTSNDLVKDYLVSLIVRKESVCNNNVGHSFDLRGGVYWRSLVVKVG